MLVLHKNISEHLAAWQEQRNSIRVAQGWPAARPMPTDHLWLLAEWKVEKTTAVAAIYKNPDLQEDGFFLAGFETVLEESIALDFLQAISTHLKKEGVKKIIGPLPGSTWEAYGFHSEGEEALFYEEIHAPEYLGYWQKAGFTADKDFFHYSLSPMPSINISDQLATLQEKGIEFRFKDQFDPGQLVEKMYHFLHKSFQQAYLFSPLSRTSFYQKFLPLCQPAHESLLWIGTQNDEIVAVAFGMKNFIKSDSYILKTIARDPDLSIKTVGYLLALHFMQDCQERGAKEIVFANMREDNFSLRKAKDLEAKKIITKTLYQKQLS